VPEELSPPIDPEAAPAELDRLRLEVDRLQANLEELERDTRLSHVIRSVNEGLNAQINRHCLIVVSALSVWLLVLLLPIAHAKSFWHDEVYTILTAQLPITTLWRANLDGVDLSPPLNTIVTRGVHTLTDVGVIATRLPPIAGLLTAVVLLFLTVRRRTNAIVGLAAAIMPCATPAWMYGTEARGYGLSLGLFALALYGWSEAAAGRRQVLHWIVMALALTASVWNHYYAVLTFLPVVVGEAVRQIARRQFDTRPWTALICAAVGILPLWKLMSVASAQRDTFWAHFGLPGFIETYKFLFGRLTNYTFVGAALAGLALIELVRRGLARRWPRRLAVHDLAACLACLAIPAAGVVLGRETEVFATRYVVFATIGLAFAVPQLVWWLTPENGLGEAIAMASVTYFLVAFTSRTIADPPIWQDPLADRPLLVDWLKGSEPIVLTGGVTYLGLWYNLPEPARPRALYLADPATQLRQTGSNTSERGYLALARWTPVPVVRVGEFARTHRHFWLYSFGSAWAEGRLRSLGATMVERAREPTGTATLYEVTIPELYTR
jgi:hypothetical protein